MDNAMAEVWKHNPERPPGFVTVTLRRETYGNLLRAGKFFASMAGDDWSVNDTVDELLVSFDIAQQEVRKG